MGTNRLFHHPIHDANISRMTRRVALTTAWFFAGWMFGAMTAFVAGLPELMAPLAAVTAGLIAYRPAWLLRTLRAKPQSVSSQSL
jgi:hypothetical protein